MRPAELQALVAPGLLADLRTRYAEPHRAYHSWSHIEALLALFDEVHPALADGDAVLLAILFHDAIYDPTRSDNEALSAELLTASAAGVTAPPDSLARATRLIEATRTHSLSDGQDASERDDAALFLDLDLSILGASPERFDAYEQQVRQEYAFVPAAAFATGRARILQGFLGRETLYFSAWGRQRFEQPARANLQRSLAALGG